MPKDNSKVSECVEAAANIVAFYVANNNLRKEDVAPFLTEIVKSLAALKSDGAGGVLSSEPAVPIDQSITDKYLICLEDGKKCRMLKRYLRTHFDLSPEEYRQKWGLPYDYPMSAPGYARKRSKIAKTTGLGKTKTMERASKKKRSAKKSVKRKSTIKKAPQEMIAKSVAGRRIIPSLATH